MTDALAPFDFNGSAVRVQIDDQGNPWFVATDVARVLGFASAKDAIRGLRDSYKGRQIVPTLGGDQEVATVNEPGLYDLVLRSRRPEAERFRVWVVEEVLPALRKTGSYGTPKVESFEARVLGVMQELVAKVDDQARQLAEAAPKVAGWEQFIGADGLFTITASAKVLGWRPTDLRDTLLSVKRIYRGGDGRLLPGAKYADAGHFVTKAPVYGDKARAQLYITPKGLDAIARDLCGMQRMLPGMN